MANEKDRIAAIEARLDLIAHLLVLAIEPKSIPPINVQIALLADHGLTPAEIGRIIGRKANYVSAMMKPKRKGGGNA